MKGRPIPSHIWHNRVYAPIAICMEALRMHSTPFRMVSFDILIIKNKYEIGLCVCVRSRAARKGESSNQRPKPRRRRPGNQLTDDQRNKINICKCVYNNFSTHKLAPRTAHSQMHFYSVPPSRCKVKPKQNHNNKSVCGVAILHKHRKKKYSQAQAKKIEKKTDKKNW